MDARRRSGVRTAALLYLLVSLLCTQIPLLNYLGYESSLAIALLGSLVAGTLSVGWTRAFLRSQDEPSGRKRGSLLRFAGRSLAAQCLLLAVPLTVLLGNALFVKNCSFPEGVAFYLLLPGVSVVFSTSLGIFCALHYRRARIVFVGFMVLSFLYALALGYFTPAIFSYNVFYGYFPGLTYDEILRITPSLLLFRALTLGVAALLVWLAHLLHARCAPELSAWRKGRCLVAALWEKKNRPIAALGLGIACTIYAFRCPLGFESSASFIRQELGSEVRTAHFVIFYQSSSLSEEEIARIAAEHEFQLSRILRELALDHGTTIESYIYPSAEVKQRLIGAGTTNIAKPWNSQIHVTRSSLAATLKHELTHVVAGRFGLPVIRASLSPGLVEGLAMAVEGFSGTRTLHQYAAALRRFGTMPDITRLMGVTGFLSQSSAVSYMVAGSLCRYLIDRYGIQKMVQVYGSGDYERAYGRSLKDLVAEWHRSLDRVAVGEEDRGVVEAFFRSPPIFRRVCARVIAARNADARAAFRERRYGAARDLFLASYAEAGGYEALAGYLSSLFRTGAYADVGESARQAREKHAHPLELLPLFVMLGDARWAVGDEAGADSFYAAVVAANISESSVENALVRQAARLNPERDTYLRYFLSDPADSSRHALLDSMVAVAHAGPLWRYLRGRNLERGGDDSGSVADLEQIDLGGTRPRLEAIRLRTLGSALLRMNRPDEARALFWRSLNYYRTEAAVMVADEWIDRSEWMKADGGT